MQKFGSLQNTAKCMAGCDEKKLEMRRTVVNFFERKQSKQAQQACMPDVRLVPISFFHNTERKCTL